jgi:adenine-specific DNA-methyltransferase
VFGASDEVLGALESGVDIERRIAEVYQTCRTPDEIMGAFDRLQVGDMTALVAAETARSLQSVESRNGRYFDAEVSKLDRWSDDLKLGLERELKDIDAAIRDGRRQSAIAVGLADKVEAQRAIKGLEQKRNRKRRDLFEAQDKIDEERTTLIAGIERQLAATHVLQPLFSVRWTLR